MPRGIFCQQNYQQHLYFKILYRQGIIKNNKHTERAFVSGLQELGSADSRNNNTKKCWPNYIDKHNQDNYNILYSLLAIL